MKARCYNSNSPNFKNYGGRGIIVCDEWKDDYTLFYEWAISNNYADDLTIDRIDVNGNYEPSNCQFISNAENVAKMAKYHIDHNTGAYSSSAVKHRVGIIRNIYGKPLRLTNNETGRVVFFNSRGEAVDFLEKETGRKQESLKAHLTMCLKNSDYSVSGWKAEDV